MVPRSLSTPNRSPARPLTCLSLTRHSPLSSAGQAGKEPTEEQIQTIDAFLLDLANKLKPLVLTPSLGVMSLSAPYRKGLDCKQVIGGSTFSEAKAAKLRGLKSKYDPDNVFFAVENGMTCAPAITPAAI